MEEEKKLYYFKKATTFDPFGRQLMEAIHNCCENGTGDFQKVHRSGQRYPIKTDLKFQPLGYENGSIILNEHTRISQHDFNILIYNMYCGNLNQDELIAGFNWHNNCSLLEFILNPQGTGISLNTILVFTFKPDTSAIEVLYFCCHTRGGGVIFNFLINAVKCGLKMCPPGKYPREITLKALRDAVEFYKKYGLEHGPHGDDGSYIPVLSRSLSSATTTMPIEESRPTLPIAQSSIAGREERSEVSPRGRSMVREPRRASGERSSSREGDGFRSRSRDKKGEKGGKRGSTSRMSKRKTANKKNRKSIRSRYR